jgi:hypothetical protein
VPQLDARGFVGKELTDAVNFLAEDCMDAFDAKDSVGVPMSVPQFEFAGPFGDARVEELKLLSWVAQHGELSFPKAPKGPWLDLLISLLWRSRISI